MKQFGFIGSLLLLAASIIDAKRGEKEDRGMIIRCMAENYQNGEETIKACTDCFKNVGNLETEAGLSAAKECTIQYLPMVNQACSAPISQLTAGDMEKIEEVVDCFDKTLETKNYERCIGESGSTNTEEKMVDGVMCVLKSWKWTMEYVKNATRAGKPGKRPGRPGRPGKGKRGKMGMKEKMLTMAHCANANKGNETRRGECEKCFKKAVKPSRNPRARVNPKEAILAAITGCSDKYLSPVYDKCTSMMKEKTGEKDEVMNCYIKVLVTDLVQTCSNEVDEVTAETMTTVIDCGKEEVKEFVMENASPKMLEKLGKMFGDDDDSDEDDEN